MLSLQSPPRSLVSTKIARSEGFHRYVRLFVVVLWQTSRDLAMGVYGKLKTLFIVIVAMSVVVATVLMYVCSQRGCLDVSRYVSTTANLQELGTGGFDSDFDHHSSVGKVYPFNFKGDDILVFLHMQKTGGTKFGKHLVKNLNIKYPCDCIPKRKKCTCHKPNSRKIWLFSRYSLGWPCGLHADWTELQACVPRYVNKLEGKSRTRKYLYITILREPVARCVSEFHCYQRGATWKNSPHLCNGKAPTKFELPPCFEGENWTDVTLPEFLGCSSNLAFNRQTRMLADLKLVGCYDQSLMPRERRDAVLLESAKRNLQNMAYFALVEYQTENQYLFEKTFGMKFVEPFVQLSVEDTRAGAITVDAYNLTRIQDLNQLDIKLYSFAKKLFFAKLKYFRAKDSENAQTAIKDSYD